MSVFCWFGWHRHKVKRGTAPNEFEFTRRNCLDQWTDLEHAVRKAHDAIENSGAHPLLTEARTLVLQAFEKIADWEELPVDQK